MHSIPWFNMMKSNTFLCKSVFLVLNSDVDHKMLTNLRKQFLYLNFIPSILYSCAECILISRNSPLHRISKPCPSWNTWDWMKLTNPNLTIMKMVHNGSASAAWWMWHYRQTQIFLHCGVLATKVMKGWYNFPAADRLQKSPLFILM